MTIARPTAVFVPAGAPLPSHAPALAEAEMPAGAPMIEATAPLPAGASVMPSNVVARSTISVLSDDSTTSARVPGTVLARMTYRCDSAYLARTTIACVGLMTALNTGTADFTGTRTADRTITAYAPACTMSSDRTALITGTRTADATTTLTAR